MNKRPFLYLAIGLVLLSLLVILMLKQSPPTKQVNLQESPEAQTVSHPKPSTVSESMSREAKTKVVPPDYIQQVEERSNSYQQTTLSMWRTAIDFYGKVVDEKGNPVEGASVRFNWSEVPALDGTGNSESTVSDTDGLFSLRGKHGPNLTVWVAKDGHYVSKTNTSGFSYGMGDGGFSPEPHNPVLFYLRTHLINWFLYFYR